MKKSIFVSLIFLATLQAQDFKTILSEVLSTNPNVKERLQNFKATQKDIATAQADYYPRLDLNLGLGYEHTNKSNLPTTPDNVTYDYTVYQNSLKYTQNLFNGFATANLVKEQESRTLAAAYSYVEIVNTLSYDALNAYLEVLKNRELLFTAKENVKIDQDILTKVEKLYTAGLTTLSEVNKIESSLALAQSNLVVQENTILNASYNLEKILGYELDAKEMQKISQNVQLPKNKEEALKYALEHNPSILVSRYNVELAKATKDASTSTFYPKVDIEISQSMNKNLSAIEGNDDRFRAMAYLSYNFFNGFKDSTTYEKTLTQISQELANQESIKRDITQNLKLAWAASTKLQQQLVRLNEYKEFSHQTLLLYAKEYDLGRRTLLDLLSAQNDFIGAKVQIINTKYSILYAKYRILNAMGTLVTTVIGNSDDIYKNVTLK
ncbi:TolC family outer membrane protein [Sulfurimonas sp.]